MAEPLRDPKEIQAALDEFQSLQRQLQIVLMQRQQLAVQTEEIKGAQDELGTATGDIYMLAGGLMMGTTKEAAKKDLADKLETAEVRSAAMQKQEDRIRSRLTSLRADLEKAASQVRPGSR